MNLISVVICQSKRRLVNTPPSVPGNLFGFSLRAIKRSNEDKSLIQIKKKMVGSRLVLCVFAALLVVLINGEEARNDDWQEDGKN